MNKNPEKDKSSLPNSDGSKHLTSDMLISTESAIGMINNFQEYNKDKERIVSGHITWENIKSYFNYIEQGMNNRNTAISGVEFYFAKYPGDHTEHSNSGRQTIVFFPTYNDGVNHVPVAFTKQDFIPLSKVIDSIQNKSLVLGTPVKVDSPFELNAGNKANMSPPRNP